MGLPNENYKGYVEADATQRARNIPKKSIFILHGLADLTAPYQHGVSLARALTEAGILFQYQVSMPFSTTECGKLQNRRMSLKEINFLLKKFFTVSFFSYNGFDSSFDNELFAK